jgi:hypothetical protein
MLISDDISVVNMLFESSNENVSKTKNKQQEKCEY